MQKTDYGRGLFFAMVTTVLWGVLPVLMKIALKTLSPGSIVWFRFTFAFAVLFVYLQWKRQAPLAMLIRPPIWGIVGGLCLAANYYYFLKGVETSSPSNAAVLIQLAPVMVVIIGVLMFAERFNRGQLVGLALAVAGFVLFFWEQRSLAPDLEVYSAAGGYIILAAVTWALYMTFQKHLTPRYGAQHLNLLVYGTAALALIFTVRWREFGGAEVGDWLLLAFLGLNTLLAYGSLAEAVKYLPLSRVSVIVALNPFITLTVMRILPSFQPEWVAPETIGPWGYVGAMTAIAGVILVIRNIDKPLVSRSGHP